jgi:hypothetical protein
VLVTSIPIRGNFGLPNWGGAAPLKWLFGSFAWINCAKVELRLIYFGTKTRK